MRGNGSRDGGPLFRGGVDRGEPVDLMRGVVPSAGDGGGPAPPIPDGTRIIAAGGDPRVVSTGDNYRVIA